MVERNSSQPQSQSRAFCIECASAQAEEYVLAYFEIHNLHPTYDSENKAWIIPGQIPEDFKSCLKATEIQIKDIAPDLSK